MEEQVSSWVEHLHKKTADEIGFTSKHSTIDHKVETDRVIPFSVIFYS
jgi:hypothetical protein